MKQRIRCAILPICLLFSLALSSCRSLSSFNEYSAHSFDYFDTATTITGYAAGKDEFDAVAEDIFALLSDYHNLYTIYHRYDGMENLCTVNELVSGSHRTVKVDQKIIDLLQYAKQMYTVTDGMLNVAMGSVLSLWHEYRAVGFDDPKKATTPPLDRLSEAALHTDITKLMIDEETSTVTLEDPLMKLDVGAIAKGYATECVARELENRGITGYILNVGGNVRAVGKKPNGQAWTVGIETPNDGEEYLAYLTIQDQSVVTSGSYQRYYTVNGKRYHHIINPETQMPAEGFLSVSVICKDSALADALSTALFCMPLEAGCSLVESMPDVEAIWVTINGEKTVSKGFDAYIKK